MKLHVQPDPVLSGNDHEFDISIVEGLDEMPVNSSVAVTDHFKNYDPENAVHWRNGDAITVDGDTRYGEVLTRNDGEKHLLMTYTDDNGELESVEITEDAGWTDRVWHRLDRCRRSRGSRRSATRFWYSSRRYLQWPQSRQR